jgi:hypothetical protein
MLNPKKVDYSFDEEHAAAIKAGLEVTIADISEDGKVGRKLPDDTYLYRGWMLKPEAYKKFASKVTLLTGYKSYKECHYLPGWYPLLIGHTPPSIYAVKNECDKILQGVLDEYGDSGIIIKGYVKSLKHRWKDAMYVPPDASLQEFRLILSRYLADADNSPGVVFRKYMPIVEVEGVKREFRLFFLNNKLMISGPYWEGYDPLVKFPCEPMAAVLKLAKRITSPFFSMDVAELEDGGWTIIEVGDGGVSGLQQIHPNAFYGEMKERL